MNKIRILFDILIYSMFIGGIMGMMKVLIPHMEWLTFRYLLGMGSTFNKNSIPTYAVIYGVCMAVLEIVSSISLLTKNRIAIKFAIITLSINALGCIAAILFGDVLATGSLLIRFFAVYILIKCKKFYPKFEKDISFISS